MPGAGTTGWDNPDWDKLPPVRVHAESEVVICLIAGTTGWDNPKWDEPPARTTSPTPKMGRAGSGMARSGSSSGMARARPSRTGSSTSLKTAGGPAAKGDEGWAGWESQEPDDSKTKTVQDDWGKW